MLNHLEATARPVRIRRVPFARRFMLTTLAIQNYRSLLKLVMPLRKLNVITGPNGSGKSNLYRALRLLAETAQGGVTNAVAREGGLQSALWAGPEKLSRAMRQGTVPIQGTQRKEAVRLRLGYASKEFGYAISLGLPVPSQSAFRLDPEIKSERIWAGTVYRPAATLIDRTGSVIKARVNEGWRMVTQNISAFESIFNHVAIPMPRQKFSSSEKPSAGGAFMIISEQIATHRRVSLD